jgi:hypothetical protein
LIETPTHHRMEAVEDTPDGRGIVWKCHDCGRWLITHRDEGLIVIDRGDFFARHSGWKGPAGTAGGLAMDVRQAGS